MSRPRIDRVKRAVTLRRLKRNEIWALAFSSLMVVLAVALALRSRGIAATHAERVLDCQYAGDGAHAHDANCYDAAGNLVCPLVEREYHVHTDACYTETREVTCGLEESAGHTHSDGCYDEEGNLVCEQEESAGHAHTDACYAVTRELTCGKQEVTEVHTHGPGCFREVTVNEPDAQSEDAGQQDQETGTVQELEGDAAPTDSPEQTFTHEFKDQDDHLVLRVDVKAPEGALPEGTTMEAAWVDPATLTKKEQSAVDKAIAKKTDGKVLGQQAVDITFYDAEGQKVEPKKKVTVTFTSSLVDTKDKALVVHIDALTEKQLKDQQKALEEGKTAEQAEPKRTAAPVDNLSDQALAEREISLSADQLAVESDQFSIYVLSVATLEHTLEASDGETYTVTLDAPANAGIPADAELRVSEVYAGSDTHDEYEASAVEALGIEGDTVAMSRFFDIKIVGADGKEIQPAEPVQVRIELADAPEGAAADVVHFDSESGEPEVVETSGAEGAASFEAKGFSVYGVVYTVIIEAEDDGVYTFEGEDYTIKITCPEEANIPAGTELTVSELEPGSDEYLQHLGQLWSEVNKEYLEYEEALKTTDSDFLDIPERELVNIYQARFFDVTLVYEGEEIEPDVPVTVEVSYKNGLMATEGTITGAVHFTDKGKVDLIDDVTTTKSDDTFDAFTYQQESFSITGTYVGQEVHDIIIGPDTALNPAVKGAYEASPVKLSDDVLDAVVRASASPRKDAASESPSTEDHSDLEKPVGNKTLTPNKYKDSNNKDVEDGTYTLTLSVKGHSNQSTETEVKKSNVLFVMDRSSSMITKTVSDEITRWYYGTRNTSSWRGDLTEDNGYHFIGIINGTEVDLNVSYNWEDGGSYYEPVITYQSGTNQWGWPTYSNYPNDAPIYVVSKKTRMTAEQEALSNLYSQLLDKNSASGTAGDDTIEIAIISFGDQRFDKKSWSSETESYGWVKGRDISPLTTVTNSNRYTSGTNWEEALQYANEVISAKKNDDGADEDYYVVFLTDGEPTAVKDESGGAHHTTNPTTGQITNGQGNIYAYNEAKDDAQALVDNGYKFYNIFTYRNGEDKKYSIYLTNYAYGNGDNNGNEQTDAVKNYFSDAQQPEDLVNAFNNIFSLIETSIGHGNVSITDTMTTDAMTTTIVHGKTNGYVYTVTAPDEETVLYTVTATGDLSKPTVTFNVPASAQKTYTATESSIGGKKVYSVTTAEGKTYKMTLADVDDSTGELKWDLSAVGLLMDGCTYSVSFIVWPDQDAYDYVTALNNGLATAAWDSNVEDDEHKVTDSNGNSYWKGGVAQYPSIVKYTDGTFAVLTNTDQKLHYSVIQSSSNESEPTIGGPYYSDLPLPNPMPLKDTESKLEKVWNVERDKGAVLYQYLYESKDKNGNPQAYKIDFDITEDGSTTPYKKVTLPPNATLSNGEATYDWSGSAPEDMVTYNDKTFSKRWVQDFSIPTGLMLSTARMGANNLNTSDYTESYTFNGETYYVLEKGHDFTVSEPDMYEFDFEAPTYHPMLVDGVLMNVEFTTENGIKKIEKMTPMPVGVDGKSTLTMNNTLRGYLHVDKTVVDHEGNALLSDKTEFLYTIKLTNKDSVFTEKHIPWFGINGLFYNDGNYNYYQAYIENGAWYLQNEAGETFEITSTGFDPDEASAQTVTYLDADGVSKTLTLYGNQMTASDGGKRVTAQFEITNSETLNIANVPDGTTYEVTETQTDGYGLVSVGWEIKKGEEIISSSSDGQTGGPSINGATVTGTIVGNRDNWIHYKNRRDEADLEIYKVEKGTLNKDEKKYLEGAEFTVTMLDETGQGGYKLVESDSTQLMYQETFTSDEDGHITIPGLNPGYYEIVETKAPDGYILTSQPEYIKVELGVVTRLSKTVDVESTENVNEGLVTKWPEKNTDNSGTIRFTAASAGNVAAYLVGNEPGSELPAAGGPGTTVLTIVGAALIAAAAATLGMRRRRLSA